MKNRRMQAAQVQCVCALTVFIIIYWLSGWKKTFNCLSLALLVREIRQNLHVKGAQA
jgi:hypothetical protein